MPLRCMHSITVQYTSTIRRIANICLIIYFFPIDLQFRYSTNNNNNIEDILYYSIIRIRKYKYSTVSAVQLISSAVHRQ